MNGLIEDVTDGQNPGGDLEAAELAALEKIAAADDQEASTAESGGAAEPAEPEEPVVLNSHVKNVADTLELITLPAAHFNLHRLAGAVSDEERKVVAEAAVPVLLKSELGRKILAVIGGDIGPEELKLAILLFGFGKKLVKAAMADIADLKAAAAQQQQDQAVA